MIYHIASKNVIKEIVKSGFYSPEGYKSEGFIHCSTKNQVIPVANRFYASTKDLILLEIDDAQLGNALFLRIWKVEPSYFRIFIAQYQLTR